MTLPTTVYLPGLVLHIVLAMLLFLLFRQDLRERKVSLLLLLALIGGCVLRFFLGREPLVYPLANSLFLALQLGVLMLYLYYRYRSFALSNYLGAGDAIFWLACLWCFSPLNFVVFFIVSLLGALALHKLYSSLQKNYHPILIPLAGFQALFLLLAFGLESLLPSWTTYNDYPLLATLGIY